MQKNFNARMCNKCLKTVACKDSNKSNLMKHLGTHRINLKAEGCTVSDGLLTKFVVKGHYLRVFSPVQDIQLFMRCCILPEKANGIFLQF